MDEAYLASDSAPMYTYLITTLQEGEHFSAPDFEVIYDNFRAPHQADISINRGSSIVYVPTATPTPSPSPTPVSIEILNPLSNGSVAYKAVGLMNSFGTLPYEEMVAANVNTLITNAPTDNLTKMTYDDNDRFSYPISGYGSGFYYGIRLVLSTAGLSGPVTSITARLRGYSSEELHLAIWDGTRWLDLDTMTSNSEILLSGSPPNAANCVIGSSIYLLAWGKSSSDRAIYIDQFDAELGLGSPPTATPSVTPTATPIATNTSTSTATSTATATPTATATAVPTVPQVSNPTPTTIPTSTPTLSTYLNLSVSQIGKIKAGSAQLKSQAMLISTGSQLPAANAAISIACKLAKSKVSAKGFTNTAGKITHSLKKTKKNMLCNIKAQKDKFTAQVIVKLK